jgi:predicted enzyme related to lactoylglutathione lyase
MTYKMKHAISWFQIPVTNFERAVKFYSSILSVEFTKTKAMGFEVALFPHHRETGTVGGALYCGNGFVPNINGTTVLLNAGEDLSVALSKIEEAGGKILLPKTPINNGSGFIAQFQDTEGNRVGLHSKN